MSQSRPSGQTTVRQTEFALNGPQLTSGAEQGYRSVIISRDQAPESIRSAQLPFDDDPMAPQELPELETTPQQESLDFETAPLPLNDSFELAPTQRQPTMQPPAERQPIQGTPLQPAPLDTTMPPGRLPDVVPEPSVSTMEAERNKAQEACEQGEADLREKSIDTLNLSIAVVGEEGSDFPFECSFESSQWHDGRYWEQTVYLWKASALCHKPLFFEDEQLERYGHSWSPCCQPLVSGAHFFTRLPVLPYCMGVEPPNECIYALGHYRPGSCAPYMCNPVPLSVRGGLIQAGAATGAAFAIP